jgi:hypothetical protein
MDCRYDEMNGVKTTPKARSFTRPSARLFAGSLSRSQNVIRNAGKRFRQQFPKQGSFNYS